MKVVELIKKMFPSLTADEQKEVREVVGVTTSDSAPHVVVIEQKPAVPATAAPTMDAATEARFKGIETSIAGIAEMVKALKPTKDASDTGGCEKSDMKDAASILQDVLYRASVIAPDVKHLTADAATTMKDRKTFDEACCLHKRKTLISAFGTTDGKDAIAPFVRDAQPDFLTMDCAAVDTAFIGASELIKRKGAPKPVIKTTDGSKATVTPAMLNKTYAEFWNKGVK